MRLYVGITDRGWYEQLSADQPDEVNFWKPGEHGSFAALQAGELFLFKLHSPVNAIVGGAFFVRYSRLPISLAWVTFGEKNGVRSLSDFRDRVRRIRREEIGPDPSVGNIVLSQPFWFPKDQWIPQPDDWPRSTVQGKTFDAFEGTGLRLLTEVQARLQVHEVQSGVVADPVARYDERLTKVRLGQGGFRISVTEAYNRRCAITGESTLPVLEASHIRPYALEGPHEVSNGVLLRSDMHILFDKGLLTITPELRVEVSPQIRELYVNGKLYYSFHGEPLKSTPATLPELPSHEYLEWHNSNVFQP